MQLEQLTHVLPQSAQVNQFGHLEIGGLDTVELVKEYGTPLYIFDEQTLRNNCKSFLEGFRKYHKNTDVIYACKAFVNGPLAKLLNEENLGLDIVSGGELAIANSVGFPPNKVYFHGNNKSNDELQEAIDFGIGRIVVDNLDELIRVDKLAKSHGITQKILLRITPGVDPHTHAHTTTGALDSKFGFQLTNDSSGKAIEKSLSLDNVNLMGLHFHLGSPIFELEPYEEAITIAVNLAAKYKSQGFDMKEFSPGGGFAIAYTRNEHAPSPEEYAKAITDALIKSCEKSNLEIPKLIVEPGRAITGPACITLYTVGSSKSISGVRNYVSVDGGMGDNIRPALYGSKYEVLPANLMTKKLTEKITIAGKFCESGDVIAKDVIMPDLEAGDIVAIPATGAYCPSMANNYNLATRPAIIVVKNGKSTLIRRRENYKDLMRNDLA